MYHDFTEMPVWQKALDAATEAYKVADKLPKYEQYSLCSQIRNSAASMPGNIAEGFGRFHKKDKINFYYFSRGSAYETISHAKLAVAVDHLSTADIEVMQAKCYAVIEDINRIVKSLS